MSNISSKCWITGKTWGSGNTVSHSNRKHHRKFRANIHMLTFKSDLLKKKLRKPVAISTLRTIMKYGSLDNYLATRRAKQLTPKSLSWRNAVRKKMLEAGIKFSRRAPEKKLLLL